MMPPFEYDIEGVFLAFEIFILIASLGSKTLVCKMTLTK